MHELWIDDFACFCDDVLDEIGERPTSQHSLDRVNNNGNYEPGNIRWALIHADGSSVQNNNRRSNVFIEHDGFCLTLAQWGRRLGFSSLGNGVWDRLNRHGWTEAEAVTTPKGYPRGVYELDERGYSTGRLAPVP